MVTQNHSGISVHVLNTSKFRSKHWAMRISIPLERQLLTSAAVLPYLWMEGTSEFPSSRQLVQRTDELYGTVLRTSIQKRGSRHVMDISASSPEELYIDGAQALTSLVQELLLSLLTKPALESSGAEFSSSHVKRAIALHSRRIESLYDDKTTYAYEQAILASCQGLVQSLPKYGYKDDLDGLTGSHLFSAHQEVLKNADVDFYCVGRIPQPETFSDQMIEALRPHFLSKCRQPSVLPVDTTRISPSTNVHVEQQKVQQAKLNRVYQTNVAYGSEDYPVAVVMNGILGAFPHSKLFVNVREKHSLAYYASSRLEGMLGLLVIYAGIQPDKFEQTQSIISQQVENVQSGRVSEEELTFTKDALLNQFRQAEDQPLSIIDFHYSGQLSGNPSGMELFREQISRVSVKDVQRVAGKLRESATYLLTNEG
jgi:predicted Zn-dependent peptidase